MGIVPVGLGTRDTVRLEASLPLYWHVLGCDETGEEIPLFALSQARMKVAWEVSDRLCHTLSAPLSS